MITTKEDARRAHRNDWLFAGCLVSIVCIVIGIVLYLRTGDVSMLAAGYGLVGAVYTLRHATQ